jgi:propionyl-CoA carboxylase alpha chain
VSYRLDRAGGLAEWSVDGQTQPVTLLHRDPTSVVLEVAGVRRIFDVNPTTSVTYVDSAGGSVALAHVPRFAESTVEAEPGSLLAPMPGTVSRVLVAAGAVVEAGDPLLTIEAMKMEHTVRAPAAGVVTELYVEPGDQVEPGSPLAVLQPGEE